MKRRAALVIAVVLAFAVLAAFAVGGQTRAVGPASVLAVLAGRVELAHGTAAYTTARDGETVATGDRLRTDGAGHAVVTFFDGSTLDIAPATELTIEAAGSTDGAVDLRITQAIGRTFSSVHKLVDTRSRYEIRTPSLVAAVRGTKFEVQVDADGSAAERTTEGLVAVSSAGSEVLVPAGAETRATPGTSPAPPAPIRGPIPASTVTSPPATGSPAVPAPTVAPPQGSGLVPTPGPSPFADPSSAPLVTPSPVLPLPTLSVTAAPALPTASFVVPTLEPLPTATLAPLLTPSLIPRPTASLPPLPTLAPVTAPSLSPLPTGTALPSRTP